MTPLLKTDLYELVEGRHGRFLANPMDMYMGRSMIAYGEFSELEWQLLDRVIRPSMVVIEAGARVIETVAPRRAGTVDKVQWEAYIPPTAKVKAKVDAVFEGNTIGDVEIGGNLAHLALAVVLSNGIHRAFSVAA